jgi:PadR family transcriptional regulator PadR
MLKGVLDLCVLAILSNKPTHAYGLVEALKVRGFDQTSYGTIYPLVTRLKRLELVSQHSEPGANGPARNVLTITAEGRSVLHELLPVWRDLQQRVSRVLDEATTSEEPTHV